MTNIITLTDEQMKALQSGQAITIEPPKTNVEKWQPKDGEYYVNIHSAVPKYKLKTQLFGEVTRLAGLTRQNEEQAEQSAKALLLYARQLAWVNEHYPDYDISKKSYETDLILATLRKDIAYHLINEIQKGNVSL